MTVHLPTLPTRESLLPLAGATCQALSQDLSSNSSSCTSPVLLTLAVSPLKGSLGPLVHHMGMLGAPSGLQPGSCVVLDDHAALACARSKTTAHSCLCLQGSKTPARLPVAIETFLQGEGVKYSRPEPGLLQLAL